MTDMGKILGGIGQLFLGILLIVLCFYILPPIMTNSVISAGLSSTLKGIIWVGILMVIIGAMIVFPISKIYEGIRE